MSVSSPTTHASVTLPWVNYEMLHTLNTIFLCYTVIYTVIFMLTTIHSHLYAYNDTLLTNALCYISYTCYVYIYMHKQSPRLRPDRGRTSGPELPRRPEQQGADGGAGSV